MSELVASDVIVHYGPVQALFSVSVRVAPGELVVLLGANGAGKSTTLRALSGLVAPTSGAIRCGEQRLDGRPTEAFAASGIAHIPEGRGTFARLTVEQNLLMGLYPRRRERIDRASELDAALEPFAVLRDRLDQRAGSLSGGEQQMLAVARALISRPKILLVDEPSHGLAPTVVEDLFALFARLRTDGLGVLVVEQYAAHALAGADRAYVLERGILHYEGNPTDLVEDRNLLISSYLGSTGEPSDKTPQPRPRRRGGGGPGRATGRR